MRSVIGVSSCGICPQDCRIPSTGPPYPPDSPLRGSVVDRCIARCHLDGYQGRVLVLATPPHRTVYLATRADRTMRRTNTAMPHLQTSGVTLSDSLTWDPQTGQTNADDDEEPALKTSKCEMVRQRQKHRCLIVRLVTAVFKQIRQHLVKRLS